MNIIKSIFATVFAIGTAAAATWAAFFGGPVGAINVVAVITWVLAPIAVLAVVGLAAPGVRAMLALRRHSVFDVILSRACLVARIGAYAWSGFIFTALLEIVILVCAVVVRAVVRSTRDKYSPEMLRAMAGAET